MVKPKINSEKHIVQLNRQTTAGLSIAGLTIVKVVAQSATPNTPEDVTIGTDIKACYIQLWISGATNDQSACTVILEKTQNDFRIPSPTEMSQLNEYVNKKNILFTFQGIVGEVSNTNPIPVLDGWYKIPKGKQRFGLGDGLRLVLQAKDTDVENCGLAIFKAYT